MDWGTDAEKLFNRLARAQRASQGKAEAAEEPETPEGYDGQYIDLSQAEFFDNTASQTGGEFYGPERFLEGGDSGCMELGDMLWKVSAFGKGGGETGRSYYRYKLMNGGVNLFLRRDRHETVANLWVEMGSIPLCLHGGLENLWQKLKETLQKEGITVIRDVVSRVDIFSDFDTCGVEEFCRRFYENCKVTRARKIGKYAEEELNTALYMNGRKHTGFSIGTDIKLRVYDKRYELKTDPLKWGVFADRYDGIPEILTRVEFQLRRNALKEFIADNNAKTKDENLDLHVRGDALKQALKEVRGGDGGRIEGVDSYVAVREQLWRYLTGEWFRLTETEVDKANNHQSRAETWGVWAAVQNAVSQAVKFIRRVRRDVEVDPQHLFKMGMGCICKAAILEKHEEMSDGSFEEGGEFAEVRYVAKYFWDKLRTYGRQYFDGVMSKHYEELFLQLGFC